MFQELEVGTVRSHLPLNAVRRLADKIGTLLGLNQETEDEEDLDYLYSQAAALSQFGFRTDIVIEDHNKTPSSAAIKEDLSSKASNALLAPSILASEQAQIQRRETITTSDFLLPTNLMSSSADKIYGFYYVT